MVGAVKGKIYCMKKLMLGNEAFARGLYEAGCKVVSSYPGTPSTEITEAVAKYDEVYAEWAPNEKVAMEVALGASIGGARSFCGMKHVGLNVAADPLYTAGYTGVTAGMVIAVADDPGMHSSQNEQDSRHHAIASKTMMIEPSDSGECKEFAKAAFELSEKFDISTSALKQCFKGVYGTAIYTYMRNYRMDLAASLLTQTDEPITVIAGKVGYTNTSKFSEAFKKVKGKTPLEYRKIKI